MSYEYQICPDCFGLIRKELDKGDGIDLAPIVKPVADFATKLTDVANQSAIRREEKREKLGVYEEKKKKKAIKYFNKLKRQRKFGKLPPNLKTDDDLWNYAIQASGLL